MLDIQIVFNYWEFLHLSIYPPQEKSEIQGGERKAIFWFPEREMKDELIPDPYMRNGPRRMPCIPYEDRHGCGPV